MRVVFWTDGFWPRIGGIETQALELISGLIQMGHECLVIAQKDSLTWKDEEAYRGISIRRFDFNSIFIKKKLEELRSIEVYINQIVNDFCPHIVHLNTITGWSAFVFSMFRNRFKIPILLTAHAPYFPGEEAVPFIDRICSVVDHVCCVSKWVLEEIEKKVPSSRGKLSLVYNGLAMPKIAVTPLPLLPPVLLLIGRLSKEKGFDVALRAFFQLKQNGSQARLLIIGDGPERVSLQKLASELDLIESVKFIGSVPKEEIPAWINQATLLLVPSYFESFGLVALEAMQMQRPVIASRVGGLSEIVLEGETGLLVPPNDPTALFEAAQSLLNTPTKAIQFGLNGYRRAIENFTSTQNLTAYENLYTRSI